MMGDNIGGHMRGDWQKTRTGFLPTGKRVPSASIDRP